MGVRVILDFNRGYLEAPTGTALRTYLRERLHCDPMRITKKFTGDSCIGQVVREVDLLFIRVRAGDTSWSEGTTRIGEKRRSLFRRGEEKLSYITQREEREYVRPTK